MMENSTVDELGPAADAEPARRLLFVSHANPEDNEFASWLGSRLTGAGYDVWSDLRRLVGGEPFWSDIGEAIRSHAAAVILVLSRASYRKPGLLNEIAIATATGQKLNASNFIIPVRLDDLPFAEFPEQVIRLNAVDFSANWADGLHRLLKALQEHGLPKFDRPTTQAFEEFRRFRSRKTSGTADKAELIESSWVRVKSLPATAVFCRYGAEPRTVAAKLSKFRTPVAPLDRLGLSFAQSAEIAIEEAAEISVEHAYDVDLKKFLDGQAYGGPTIARADARRMMVNLFRQAWENFAKEKGLQPYEFANAVGWYVPKGVIENDTVLWVDRTGKTRRKRLVGRSIKRGVYWSFAVTVRLAVGQLWHLELKPQVVFTEDGVTPIQSKARMARLRRSFCKNWWNDQWRSLLRAFLQFLADGKSDIRLPLGGSAEGVFESEPIVFEAPIGIVSDSAPLIQDDLTEDETSADQLDEGEEIGDADEELEEDALP